MRAQTQGLWCLMSPLGGETVGEVPNSEQLPLVAAFMFAFRPPSLFLPSLPPAASLLSVLGGEVIYILLLKSPHVSSFILVTLCCPKLNIECVRLVVINYT